MAGEKHRGTARRSTGYSDSTPRFSEDSKPYVERPPMLGTPRVCWCGVKHVGGFGEHPWPPLDEPPDLLQIVLDETAWEAP